MITTDKPLLCGGTFLVLMLLAKRTRLKKEIQKFGNGGVTNSEMLKSLIMFFDPDYMTPAGSSLETNTIHYKSCEISSVDCLPFSDNTLINPFDKKIQTAYNNESSKMKYMAYFFLTTEKSAKMQELVYGILNLIKYDNSIKPHYTFYALPNGTSVSKTDLLRSTEVNLYALLLVI